MQELTSGQESGKEQWLADQSAVSLASVALLPSEHPAPIPIHLLDLYSFIFVNADGEIQDARV